MDIPKELKKSITELRQNPLILTEYVIITTARGNRPKKPVEPAPYDDRSFVEGDAFCVGNEHMTPSSNFSINDDDGAWLIRGVRNQYPVLDEQGDIDGYDFGIHHVLGGYGYHEVLIDHPNHGIRIHEMSVEHLEKLFGAYQSRMSYIYENLPDIEHVLVFKNFGEKAGGSMKHTHSQIFGMPVVSKRVQEEAWGCAEYFRDHRRCVSCEIINEAKNLHLPIYDLSTGKKIRDIKAGDLIIEQTEHFVAIKPFASRHEWEVHILPKEHNMDFLDCEEMADLAGIFQRIMARLNTMIPGLQYNYQIQSLHRPTLFRHTRSYHWYIEIIPRTCEYAGIELGTGLRINTIAPEDAAERLRNVQL